MKTLIVILYNIRSTYNVGAILRTCDGLGVSKVILTGYTPFLDKGLPHEQAKLKKQIHKTALGAEDVIAWERRNQPLDRIIKDLQKDSFWVMALEQGDNSLNLADGYTETHAKVALILGEEVHGIAPEYLSLCDQYLEIPMCGQKESFNVSVATGIALWELQKPNLRDTEKYLRRQK